MRFLRTQDEHLSFMKRAFVLRFGSRRAVGSGSFDEHFVTGGLPRTEHLTSLPRVISTQFVLVERVFNKFFGSVT